MQDTDWAYFAGMVDGEGYIDIMMRTNPVQQKTKKGYAIEFRFLICGNNLEHLKQVQQSIGGMGYFCLHKMPKNKPWTDLYSLRFTHNQARVILPMILPYLKLKKDLAQIVIETLELVKQKGKTYETEYKILKNILLLEKLKALKSSNKIWAKRAFHKKLNERLEFLSNLPNRKEGKQ